MARLCERPGCSQPADVTYGIDADHLTVWIEPFDGAVAFRAGVLCRRHADAMVVPLGWMLDDRREAAPRLFKPREPAPLPRARGRRARHGRTKDADETGQLQLAPVADAGEDDPPADSEHAAHVAEHASGDAPAEAWKPVFDQSDDLGGLLKAQSPLLSRAFGRKNRPG
ncbi:MAG: DUF3499 family protein [Ilumatobacteraceae bacterium]|nr:DUF3499 family protein [Ilumatobacteraceae bacterium]